MRPEALLTRADVTMLMHFALGEAERGLAAGEIPIGCVAAALSERGLRILAGAHEASSPDGHAVMRALAAASTKVRPHDGGFFLVSTVEPCSACIDRCQRCSVGQLIYGLPRHARNGKGLATCAPTSVTGMRVLGGVDAERSRSLLRRFVDRHVGIAHAITYAEDLLVGHAA